MRNIKKFAPSTATHILGREQKLKQEDGHNGQEHGLEQVKPVGGAAAPQQGNAIKQVIETEKARENRFLNAPV